MSGAGSPGGEGRGSARGDAGLVPLWWLLKPVLEFWGSERSPKQQQGMGRAEQGRCQEQGLLRCPFLGVSWQAGGPPVAPGPFRLPVKPSQPRANLHRAAGAGEAGASCCSG